MNGFRIVRHIKSSRDDCFSLHTFRRVYPTMEAAVQAARHGTCDHGAWVYRDVVYHVAADRAWIPVAFANPG